MDERVTREIVHGLPDAIPGVCGTIGTLMQPCSACQRVATHIATLDTALAASRAACEAFRQDFNTVQAALATTQEKLRDAERARDDARELVALEFERGKLCGIAEEREHAEQFKARWFHQTTQEAIARAEHAEQRVKGLEAMVERKNAALARPCISCGYTPNVIKPATPPPVAPSGAMDCRCPPDWCAASEVAPYAGSCQRPVAPSGGAA